jgi:hypothetical protein
MVNKEDFADKAAQAGNAIQYSGATGSIIAGLALSEIGVIIGMVIAVCGFFINWYYKHKSYMLLVKRTNAETKALKSGKITVLEESDIDQDNG